MKKVQAAGHVQRDLLAATRPGVLAVLILGERPPQIPALSQRQTNVNMSCRCTEHIVAWEV